MMKKITITFISVFLFFNIKAQDIQEKKIKILREKRDSVLFDKKMEKLRNACENNLKN